MKMTEKQLNRMSKTKKYFSISKFEDIPSSCAPPNRYSFLCVTAMLKKALARGAFPPTLLDMSVHVEVG